MNSVLLLACLSQAAVQPNSLGQWAEANGIVISSKVNVDHSVFRIVAAEDIKASDVLLSLPSHLAFTDNALPPNDALLTAVLQKTEQQSIDPKVRLAIAAVQEGSKRTSPYAAWLNSIPLQTECPLMYSEEDLELVSSYDVFSRLSLYRKSVQAVWTEFIQPAVDSAVTNEFFTSTFAFVMGRRTVLQKTDDSADVLYVLLPLINTARHSNNPNSGVVPRILKEGVPAEQFLDAGVANFELTAARDIKKGEEITINFGFADNYESFIAQGVVQEGTAANGADLDSLTFVVQKPDSDELVANLKKLDITTLQFRVTPKSIPVTLLQYLRIKHGANVDDETARELLTKGAGVTLDNDHKALRELLEASKGVEKLWKTTLEEDEELLKTSLPRVHEILIRYRLTEKRVIKGLQSLVKEIWALWLN